MSAAWPIFEKGKHTAWELDHLNLTYGWIILREN
jgi:hypothetical protein